jgi:hypothetical protein
MATPAHRRELVLDNGRVFVEVPGLMTDDELADVLAAFVDRVRARPPKPSLPVTQVRPSPLPAFRKRKPR